MGSNAVSRAADEPPQLNIARIARRLQPSLPPSEAQALAEGLSRLKRSGRCQTPWEVLIAVADTESSLRRGAINRKTSDYGLMQINAVTLKKLNLTAERLLKDMESSLSAGCQVIDENRNNYAYRFPYWLGAYRAGVHFERPQVKQSAQRYDSVIRNKVKEIRQLARAT